MRGKIKTDITDLQRIIRYYYRKLHDNKLGNPGEMVKFLETYNLLTLNHQEIENLNRPVTSKEI